MHAPSGGEGWVVAYVGSAWSFGDGSTPVDEHEWMTVQHLDPSAISSADVDALVVDDDVVDDVVAGLEDETIPLVAVGTDETLTLTSAAFDRLDEHVVVADEVAPLTDRLETVLTDRWQNLGMTPERFLDVLFERAPAHLYVKDADGRHVRSNEFYDVLGDLVGLTDKEVYPHEGFTEQSFADDMRVIETGEPIVEKEEFNPGDDNWTITTKMPVTHPSGETVGLVGFTQLITTRKEYERALERQNDRLEQFAQILSHDLRNPLSVANGHLKLARETHPDDDHLAAVAESLDRIDELVEDVLTLTRGGQRVVETEVVSLESVCRSCWDVVATADGTLSVTDLQITADEGRLRHVFENLFRNAVEHAGTDASVDIGPLGDGDGFYVADDGPGIPPAERDQIFERGYTTSPDGTGLGLEIVRQIVDAHGWEIDVTESETGGTRFEIRGVDVVDRQS
jgi:two-component sensor histidine kinase